MVSNSSLICQYNLILWKNKKNEKQQNDKKNWTQNQQQNNITEQNNNTTEYKKMRNDKKNQMGMNSIKLNRIKQVRIWKQN